MEKKEYEVMFNIEDNYWWYVGLRKLVFSFIDKFSHKRNGLRILDAGCGTGGILERCNVYGAYGLEISEEAIKFCKLRKLNNLVRGSVCDVPFKNNSFDIVISLGVLYHKDVKNDLKTLEELYRVVDENGILLLTLPAYNFLRSRHDKAVHTRHRYTIKELKEKVKKAGFRIERITYQNTILFPLAVIIRVIGRIFFMNTGEVKSDLRPLPGLFNKFLTSLLFLENRLIMSGLNFPFGLSLYCMAKKMK
jgi:SAM-dependent methyltransferase